MFKHTYKISEQLFLILGLIMNSNRIICSKLTIFIELYVLILKDLLTDVLKLYGFIDCHGLFRHFIP
jgi:hypothetical protein